MFSIEFLFVLELLLIKRIIAVMIKCLQKTDILVYNQIILIFERVYISLLFKALTIALPPTHILQPSSAYEKVNMCEMR